MAEIDNIAKSGNPTPEQEIARDFFGRTCPSQANDQQLPVLTRNFRSPGCDISNFSPPASGSGDIDVLQTYRDQRPSVTYFKMQGVTDGSGKEPADEPKIWGGTGVTVGKEGNHCLVLTDDHVPQGVPQQHVKATGMEVVMAGEKSYPATVISRDQAHDLAIVKVETGPETDKVCRPATVVDQTVAADGAPIMAIGQPYTSHSMYTTTGSLSSTGKRSDISSMIQPLPGEDANRPIFNMFMPIREGFSGGPVFGKDGKVIGINDLETSPITSVATPVNRAMVDEMLAKRTDKP